MTPLLLSSSITGMGACRTSAVSLPAACSVRIVATNLLVESLVYSALMPYFFWKASITGSTEVMLA